MVGALLSPGCRLANGSAINRSLVTSAGFEPATVGLEVRCSIQLSYEAEGKPDDGQRNIRWCGSMGPGNPAVKAEIVGIGNLAANAFFWLFHLIGDVVARRVGNCLITAIKT